MFAPSATELRAQPLLWVARIFREEAVELWGGHLGDAEANAASGSERGLRATRTEEGDGNSW